jgi:hypothetical protein
VQQDGRDEGRGEVKLRRIEGPDGPVDIDGSAVRMRGPVYHIAVTGDGYSVTVDPGFPMIAPRPKRIKE